MNRRALRPLAWLGALTLPVVYTLIETLPHRTPLVEAVTQTAYVLPFALSSILAWLSRGRATGAQRRFWTYLALACGVLVLNESYAAVWIVSGVPFPPALPIVSAILTPAAAVLWLSMLLTTTPVAHEHLAVRLRYYVDLATGILVAAGFALMLAVRPLLASHGAPDSLMLVASFYMIAGLTVVFGLYTNVFGLRVHGWHVWERIVLLGLSVYGLGGVAWPLWYLGAVEGIGFGHHVVEFMWVAGQSVVAVGCFYRLTALDAATDLPPAPAARRRLRSWAYPLLLAVSAMGLAALLSTSPATRGLIPPLTALLAIALVLRSALFALETAIDDRRRAVDALTGLQGHSRLTENLAAELVRGERSREPVSVLVFDVAGTGAVNERDGRSAADARIAAVAKALRAASREHEVYRSLEDDFGIILPGMDAKAAFATGMHIRWQAEDRLEGELIACGIASAPAHAGSAERLLELATVAAHDACVEGTRRVLVHVEREHPFASGETGHVELLRSLARAVDDDEGGPHSARVAGLAGRLARRLLLSEERVALVELAAELHDVGKAALALRHDSDPSEHAVLGARLLDSPALRSVADWVLAHHETWDGSGFPRGLAAEEIPLEARIIAVCDTYARDLAEGGQDEALERLGALRGSLLDPFVVDQFFFSLRAETDGDERDSA